MSNVSKYNLYKGVSTFLTVGTPIVTLAFTGDFFVQRPSSAISAAGMFVLLICALFLKDKIAEKFKCPSTFVVSTIGLVFIVLIENILLPMKAVCIATMITSGVDELTFKRLYKQIESLYPNFAKYKHVGFVFATEKTIMETNNE